MMLAKLCRNAYEGIIHHFPRSRRKIAWQRGVEDFFHGLTKFPYGMLVTLFFLWKAGLVDLVKVAQRLLFFDMNVVMAFVCGAIVAGVATGGAAFRKWGVQPDPMMETRVRARSPKTPV